MITSSQQDGNKNRTLSSRQGALMLLALVWVVSLAVLAARLPQTLGVRAIFLGVPAGITMLVTVMHPGLGFRIWGIGLALLATQTGFQLDVAGIRTSALEVGIIALLGLLFTRRQDSDLNLSKIPGQRYLFLFAFYSIIMLLISLMQDMNINQALFQFKGFLLYPLMAYVLVVGLREREALTGLALILAGWYGFVAINALADFARNFGANEIAYRATADYAPQNILGVTLITVALFVLGIALQQKTTWQRLLSFGIVLLLIAGGLTSLSRTAVVAFVIGIFFLFFAIHQRRMQLFAFAVVITLILLLWIPESALENRLVQLTDSSTARRTEYLISGLHAWKARWLTGWGWGHSFNYVGSGVWALSDLWHSFFTEQGSLVSRGSMPWYHNDYLNLAVQTGLIGLGLYLAFWQRVLAAAQRWLKAFPQSKFAGYALGAAAALLAILVSALFEHTLWRPDAAGLVGLWLGILCAAMRLGSEAATEEESA